LAQRALDEGGRIRLDPPKFDELVAQQLSLKAHARRER
jgi:hypothetical protein